MLNRANSLRYKVDILAADAQTPVITDMWADVESLAGRRLELAQMLASEATQRVTCRYDSTINSSYFVAHDGVLYAIDYLRDPGEPFRKCYLEIYCHNVGDGTDVQEPIIVDGGTF